MARKTILIDCDPGQDDAVMLLLAFGARDELDILGITTVAGNVPLAKTQRNARIICELGGVTDIPVFAGCDRPMMRHLVTAEHVHGREGIDGTAIYDPTLPLQTQHAVDFIVDALMKAADDSITLVPTGPLTNIGMAIVREPRILPKIREIVLMGGAMREGGNTTPSAEFNIYVDPHAANIVFRCGRPIVVMPLDVTHQVITTGARVESFANIGNVTGNAVKAMMEFYNRFDEDKYGTDGGPLHDPCTIAYLLAPDLFSGKAVNVTVETQSELTMGATVTDFWRVTERGHNATWIHGVNADGFFDLLNQRIARLP
ncbi:MAG: nucleoside hydrolase [Proteobacteria bacterium]|nr:nucleoside hydrolase [Pseudomonadota bacterium]MDA1057704.1 nucleoside hydrolase [Pseudomonadota bacterium]